jgi:hypothetical protein
VSILQSGLSPVPDPAATLSTQLHHATALRWNAVLEYRGAMAAQGETVLLARFGGQFDHFLRLVETPVGEDLVVLGRDGEGGRLWAAVPGHCISARFGESVLHGDLDTFDLWQVCGRFRRITTAAHPNTPAEPVHVLHRIEGADE